MISRKEVFQIPNNNDSEQTGCISYEQMNIMNQFHNHMADLTIWSRALLIALKFNLANTDDVFTRLLQESKDTQEIMSTFFGPESANQFSDLLTRQTATFRHLAEALIANNSQEADASFKELYQIAEDIAHFFTNLYPGIKKELWHSLFHEYYQRLYQESFAIASGNYTEEIDLFDSLLNQSYLIGDYISNVVISNLHSSGLVQLRQERILRQEHQ